MKSAFDDRRVVITGVGLVSPLGSTANALWESLVNGRSGVRPLPGFLHGDQRIAYGAKAEQFTGHIDQFGELGKDQKKMIRKALKLMCRETMMGVAVAQAALQDAGLDISNYSPDQAGCVFGSDYMLTMPDDFVGGFTKCSDEDGQFDYQRWGDEGIQHVTPLWLLKYLPNMPASHVAIYNDLRGPNNSLTLREAASDAAMGEACFTIARGHADVMVAGATGTRIHPMNAIHAMQQEQISSPAVAPEKASRPFDADRTGMVLGEGAAAVVLETAERAQERGATIYGEVIARASSTVASPSGVADRRTALQNVLRKLMADAEASPAEIGHIHAHGISTHSGDAEEAQAIASILGHGREGRPVTAAKSYFGNLGAGSGAVELIASLMALRHGHLFAVLNYERPDPECPIHVAVSPETPAGNSFINLSVTPQGQAAALAVRSFT